MLSDKGRVANDMGVGPDFFEMRPRRDMICSEICLKICEREMHDEGSGAARVWRSREAEV
jgi:hypothetical protein